MMKDDLASGIRIPSVFISYTSGEWLLDAMRRAVPWDPLRVSIDVNGERKLTICRGRRQVGGCSQWTVLTDGCLFLWL